MHLCWCVGSPMRLCPHGRGSGACGYCAQTVSPEQKKKKINNREKKE